MDDGDPRIGTVLKGKWTVDAPLGRGGMATVYAATHRNGKRVAVKMLHAELSRDAGIRERFVREGYLANKVGRGAVTVDDDDVTDDGAVFLVMELLEGETLEARRERSPGGRLAVAEVVAAMDQVLSTLASAHAQGIVHRDLKPENMFRTGDGEVKLLDFGIARLREASGVQKSNTATGTLMGTPAYLPPEQARGRWAEVDARSDIWAVGATMFTLLTGRCVHESETVPELLLLAMTAPAPALRSVAPDVPEELAGIVDRALARERDVRWPDARTMQSALHTVHPADLSLASAARQEGARFPAPWPVVVEAATPESAGGVGMSVPSTSTATVAVMTSRTLSPGKQIAARTANRRPGFMTAGAVAAVAAIGLTLWVALPRPATPPASAAAESPAPPSAVAELPAVSAAGAEAAPAPPAEHTAKPISVSDLPDVAPAASANAGQPARPRPTTSLSAPRPAAAPAVKPVTPAKGADPFSARR